MKKIIGLFAISALLLSCDKEKVIPKLDTPLEIQDYTETHFPSNAIIQTIEEKEGFKKSYDVLLEGNFSLEFDKKYNITEIDGVSALPNSVIPTQVLSYVNSNYPNEWITEWSLESNFQVVELNNHIELEFNMDGDFIRVDN